MEALTDKIIDDLMDEKKEHKSGLYNAAFCDGLTYAISTIIEFEKEADFEEVGRMMMKYLSKNYNPHCTVIITNSTCELVEGLKSVGQIMDYIKD